MPTPPVMEGWKLINEDTGETRDIVLFEGKREQWEKVYAKSLADLLELTGGQQTLVLAHMIRIKDYQNRVLATVRSIAKDTGVSTDTVQRTLKALQEQNYLLKIRNGLWRFSPHVMVNGKAAVGAAVFRMWDKEHQVD